MYTEEMDARTPIADELILAQARKVRSALRDLNVACDARFVSMNEDVAVQILVQSEVENAADAYAYEVDVLLIMART